MNKTTKALILGGSLVCLSLLGWVLWQREHDALKLTDRVAATPTPSKPAAEEIGSSTPTLRPDDIATASNVSTPTSPQVAQTPEIEHEQLQRELDDLLKTEEFREMMGRIERKEKPSKADLEFMAKARDIQGRMIPEPPLFKAPGFPPKTPEAQAMWDWWNTMQKTDSHFEYKRPIVFYGKVVDEAGNPVADGRAVISLTSPAKGLKGR